jgi:cytoskeleton protein RodZ
MEGKQVETAEREETIRLGPFLRYERERMNLSQDEIAQKIRLRRFIVEAIENEAWERLPPPVFVKGFVRSYAKTLDLDEKRVLDLYYRAAPPEPEILKPVDATRASHRVRILLSLLVVAALGCVAYFWYVKASTRDRENLSMAERAAPVEREVSRPDKQEKVMMSALPETLPGTISSTPPEQRPQEQAPAEDDSAPATDRELPALTLKALVKERTWISIRVDGDEPKEFIFQPGARPQWKGTRGFEIVVGNAAGVDFELDGKRIENLGQPGQVVRLSLPEGAEPGDSEE